MPELNPDDRQQHLLTVAHTLQECQRILDHYNLCDVSAPLDGAIVALQNHVEFEHSMPDDLAEFFGLEDLKEAENWWKDKKPEA
jgi:hypothetical protein